MKKVFLTAAIIFMAVFTTQAQDKMDKTTVISLEQTPGEFTKKQLTVTEGTYVFEVKNNGVGHDVGFVLVKKGKDISDANNHIKNCLCNRSGCRW